MSGKFYQRYVPPTAKESASSTGSKSLKSKTQPSNHFFNRYEPPPAAAQSGSHETERPAKRRKHDDKALPHREKTFKKAADIVEAGPGENGFEKHQGLREKFEKAQKRSDKQRENDIERESGQNDDDNPTTIQYGLQPLPQPVNEEPVKVSRADHLPIWLENPVRANKDDRTSMNELQLSDKLCENLRKGNFTEAFAIQSTVIPMLLPGKSHHDGDVCVSASTGSGKTLSYVLPMVEALREKPVRLLRGLIVVPTRELVNQVREMLEICTAGTKVKVGVAVGSRNLAEERKYLLERQILFDPDGHKAVQRRKAHKLSVEDLMDWDRGSEDEYDPPYAHVAGLVSSVDVLVCTPGRLVDHVRSTKGFHLHDVQWLVIDEADRLLDQSFQQWIDTIVPELKWLPRLDEEEQALRSLWRMPRRRRVQKVILSATMTRDISKLLSLELRRPKMVVLDRDVNATEQEQPVTAFKLPSELREVAVKVENSDQKPLALVQLLRKLLENPGSRPNGHNADKDRMDVDTSDDSSNSSDDEDDHDDSDSEDSVSSTSDQSDVSTSSSGSESDSSDMDSISDTDLASQSNRMLKQQSRSGKQHGVLIFTNTNESAQRLSRLLGLMKSDWQSHIGTLSKSTASSLGRRLLSAFRAGRLSILIASDRASRGLDIKDLPAVVNYDMPTSALSYIHRVGRTARAGSAGTAYTFVAHHEARWFWTEIGKSEVISRSGRIARQEDLGGKDVPEKLMADYKSSLEKLGEEARGT